MTESTKLLGRPSKRDVSYVKLDNYIDDRDVECWIMRAEECVRLRGIKEVEAAGYVLYHIQGGGGGKNRVMLTNIGCDEYR